MDGPNFPLNFGLKFVDYSRASCQARARSLELPRSSLPVLGVNGGQWPAFANAFQRQVHITRHFYLLGVTCI